MLASLELRAPFLDKNIIEFAFSKVPSTLKVNLTDKKIFLKLLAKKKLPAEFDFQRKQGFVPPMEHWLKEKKWDNFLKENLLMTKDSWWNINYIEHLWKGQQRGRFNKRRLFALLMIELWRKQYSAQL
jgi:asparagine synthase (glutamine-hydrolysing)